MEDDPDSGAEEAPRRVAGAGHPGGTGVAGASAADGVAVYATVPYGTGEFQQLLHDEGIAAGCRTQPASAPDGLFTKDRFAVDLDADTVTCPDHRTVAIRRGGDATGAAVLAGLCADSISPEKVSLSSTRASPRSPLSLWAC